MSVDRRLLARYLRQLADLGIEDLVLDHLTPADAIALLTGASACAPPASPRGQAAAAGAAAAEPPLPPPLPLNVPVRLTVPPPGHEPASVPAPKVPQSGSTPLAELARASSTCTLCRLHETRTSVVFGEGSEAAEVVVVGEAPGQEEDRTGRPFVGRAGKLLDLLLMTAGFPRETVYICNVLKCRPPNNRNPLADEVEACTTRYLHSQVAAIGPRVVLAVGKFAAQALLGSEESIGRLRGIVHEWRGTPLIVTYHPAYLLRSPQMTRVAWQDFQLLRKVLDEQT
jgi:uracil-DNA glycosylase